MSYTPKLAGSIFQAYNICKRQAWLMSRQITGDQYNEFLAIGRLISEESFKRDKKELRIGSNVIDVVRKKDGSVILIETKKSSRAINASKSQLLFYQYNLRYKINNLKGEIRIPKEKKIINVVLDKIEIEKIDTIKKEIQALLKKEKAPEVKKSKFCKKCSYYDFCWS